MGNRCVGREALRGILRNPQLELVFTRNAAVYGCNLADRKCRTQGVDLGP